MLGISVDPNQKDSCCMFRHHTNYNELLVTRDENSILLTKAFVNHSKNMNQITRDVSNMPTTNAASYVATFLYAFRRATSSESTTLVVVNLFGLLATSFVWPWHCWTIN